MSLTSAAGTAIARGGQSAKEMSQPGVQPSPFDVWTHSYDGMADGMQAAANDPVGFLKGDPAQLARAQAAAMNLSSASANQIENSMTAQASALGDSVTAVGQAEGALQTVGATFALLTGVEQMLSTLLSAIPFPALPAVRILDFDIGLPHAHSHPPNLIPPAPPVPLPSMGPVIPIPILSGASTVLVNGMPAGRCGDMGLGIWCGGYFPMYEVFLGSSSVWIEGARAARLLVDITKHCIFTTPKPNDPPLGPMVGTTISCSMNVLIGGVPMPSLTALGIGAAMKGLFKLAGKGAKAFARLTGPLRRRMADALGLENGFLRCKIFRAEPVNFITGEVIVNQNDFTIPRRLTFTWTRRYGSHSSRKGVCGYGWSTPADARLVFEDDGAVLFHDGRGGLRIFPFLPSQGTTQELVAGANLEATDDILRVHLKDGLTYVFMRSRFQSQELLVRQLEDRCGNSLSYVRDEHGLREIVESSGRRIEVKSERGLIREMWLRPGNHAPAHRLVRYEYSDSDELLAVYDALDQPHRFYYENRRLARHTGRDGLSFYYAYDSLRQNARCCHSWGDSGLYDYQFIYDPNVRRATVRDSLGSVSTIQLNEVNLPIWEVDALGSMTRYEYDACGRTIAVTDPEGRRTQFEYDVRGNPIKVTRADGSFYELEFNEDNKAIRITDPNGAQWNQQWDARGLLLKQVTPLGHTSRYQYDAQGQLIAHTNPRGARTEFSYDDFGNLINHKNALGHQTQFVYDTRGNLTSVQDAIGRRNLYHFDAKDRLIAWQTPAGEKVRCAYDAVDRLLYYADEAGVRTQFEYFGQGLVKKCIQGDGHITEYDYDTEERVKSVTNQRGETHWYIRDAAGRITEEVDYWGQKTTYTLDANGEIRKRRDAAGRVLTFTRDNLGRILTKSFAHPDRPKKICEETFEYDAVGNITGCANEHVKVERRFNTVGLLIEESIGAFKVTNQFDEAGNRVKRETSAGNITAYEYDALDQVISIQVNNEPLMRMHRDAVGQVTQESFGIALDRHFTYDAAGHLTSHSVLKHVTQLLFQTRYAYDQPGNLTLRVDSHQGADHYRHDPVNQVIKHIDPQGQVTQLVQDATGDRLATRPVVNGDWSRQGDFNSTHFKFDCAGALIERDATQFTWDADERLVRTRTNGTETTYAYDPLGRRLLKRTGDKVTWFGWDGDAIAAEGQGAPGLADREYIHYPGSYVPLALIDRASGIYFYHVEPNGSPTRLIRPDGKVVWQAKYDVWGSIKNAQSNGVANPLRLQGQYEDEETALHYNRYRYFDAQLGQFISKDPLGLTAGANPYRYAPNALLWIDPRGLHSVNATLVEQGSNVQRPILNPRMDPDMNRHWPNEVGSGSNPGSALGRVGDSEEQLLKHLEDLHNAGEIDLKGSTLSITSELRGGHTPLPPCKDPGGCAEALQRFANKYKMSIFYQSDPNWRGKPFFHSYKPC
jgi:RHS repeat-associated protein